MGSRLRNLADEPPGDWDVGYLGDVCKVRRQQVSPSDVDETSYVGLEHMTPGRRYIDAWGSSTDVESAKFKFHKGDILFGKLRPYLRKVSTARHDGICSTDIMVIAPKQIQGGDFILYLCQSERVLQFATSTSGGTRMPRTSWSDLRHCPVLLPPPEERRKIAAILRSLDEAVERTEAVIAALREFKRGMMQELLTKGISEDGEIRNPEAHPEQFHETKLGLLPEAWEVVRVSQAGDVRLGRQRAPQHQSGQHTTPYLRVANVFDGYIDYSDVLAMDFTPAERRTYSLVVGDILLNEGQSTELVGRSAIYDGDPDQYCFQNTLVRFRCNTTTTPLYCRAVFKRWLDTGRFQVIASQTTSVAHLGAERFARMFFPRPPLAEQEQIGGALSSVDSTLAGSDVDLGSLRALKRGLMQQLLTGKMRVKV